MGIAFAPDEVRTDEPTRRARLKWVIVVADGLAAGSMVNAAACVAAVVGREVDGLLGSPATDGSGAVHPGLPWAGCTVLRTDENRLRAIRARAATREDMLVADMPAAAQQTRVYDEYLAGMAAIPTDHLPLLAVSVVGPRNAVDKLVHGLPLL